MYRGVPVARVTCTTGKVACSNCPAPDGAKWGDGAKTECLNNNRLILEHGFERKRSAL